VGFCGLAILDLSCGSVFGAERDGQAPADSSNGRDVQKPQRATRGAGGMEEQMKMMMEHTAQYRQRTMSNLQNELGASDSEWAVIKPRVETVYDLVHPVARFQVGSEQPTSPVDQSKGELRRLLSNKETPPEQIKAALTALRTAKEKARQNLAKARQDLRQVMTLRQEAVLVLNELLD
jgi:flagellar biosynthesis chaperone FliJ